MNFRCECNNSECKMKIQMESERYLALAQGGRLLIHPLCPSSREDIEVVSWHDDCVVVRNPEIEEELKEIQKEVANRTLNVFL